MYKVINKSSGIVAYSCTERGQALYWYQCNNFDDEGNDLGLYQVIKG
jgi:hypothetical protein